MRYVIVGNGVAGTTAAEHMRNFDESGEIVMITEEDLPFYSRIRLIEYLSGAITEESLMLKHADWYAGKGITLMLRTTALDIDADLREVVTDSGRLAYDRLLLATGGVCFVPPITGADKLGVFTLRSIADARAIRRHAGDGNRNVLVIGGGVLGLEVGHSLIRSGCSVAVAEAFPRLLPRQLDTEGASMLQRRLERDGFKFYLGSKPMEIIGGSAAEGVVLEDGRRIACDMIIISAGVRPNALLARKIGLQVEKGVPVNDRMETAAAGVYAAGDLVQHRGTFYGIWIAAQRQGEIAGINMAGGYASYDGTTVSNMLKIAGISLVSIGEIDAEGSYESIVDRDEGHSVYRKLVIRDGVIIGAILFGNLENMTKIQKAIETRRFVGSAKSRAAGWDLSML